MTPVSRAIRLILASHSPARLATLQAAGLQPDVIVAGVDESSFHAPTPTDLVALLARHKAEAVFAGLDQKDDVIVIGCDSVLDFDGEPQGKPGSAQAAVALLRRTRGRSGTLVTGHHLIVATDQQVRRDTRVGSSVVHMADMTDAEVEAYVATGEPVNVAGGFTIDGLGGPFISAIEGDYHNVVGISLPLLRLMLMDCGVSWPRLWRSS
ncbi:MAG: Maf family nucleotide pyrophosphatase [Propionibacteriaceae bacterium]|nr:Maf family nucleotide pyrophosphatase [Propionibacteriaceae bacterium]